MKIEKFADKHHQEVYEVVNSWPKWKKEIFDHLTTKTQYNFDKDNKDVNK